jgi:hypothetical protein
MTNPPGYLQPGTLENLELKTIEVRLSAIREATQRSRFIFIIMTIMCSTIIAGVWNTMLSWERGSAFDFPNNAPSQARSSSDSAAVNQFSPEPKSSDDSAKIVKSEWLKNLYVSAGILGIRVSTNDLAVVGSASLIVVMVWYFFSQRRENRAIVGLLRDCTAKLDAGAVNRDVGKLVYEGIVQNVVFINIGGGDRPIKGIYKNEDDSKPENEFVRYVLIALTFLPSITIAGVILADLVSLANESYVEGRGKGPVLLALMLGHKYFALVKVVAFETFALVAFGYTLRLCELCRRFSNATATTVKQFQRRVWSKAEEKQANVHEVSRVEKFFKIIWYAMLRVLRLEPEEEAISTFATDARD